MNRHDHELAAHHSWLRRMARRLARSSARADDLIQDTYVTALRNAPPDAQLRPWLRAVMRKLAWGEVRSERRRIQREEGFSLIAPALTMPESLLDHGANRERLTEALVHLPEPFRSTIVQRFLNGRSCADIARSENVPAGTVRWRQARGIELLRAELAPPRRGRAIWALPFLGAGQRLVAHVWQTLARTGGSKAFWLWLALAAAIYVIHESEAVLRVPSADRITHARGRGAVALANAPRGVVGTIGSTGGGDRRDVLASRRPTNALRSDLLEATAPDGVRERSAAPVPASLDAALDIRRDDCQWDPVNGWHCPGAVSSSAPSTDAMCALVHRRLLESEALARVSLPARVFSTAAIQANRALAERFGCWSSRVGRVEGIAGAGARTGGGGPGGSSGGGPGGGSSGGGGDGSGSGEPTCVSQADADGTPCTVCPGEAPVCERTECHDQLGIDGVMCTTCVGPEGEIHSDCPQEPRPACQSVVADSGLLCSTCDSQPGVVECLPAECSVVDRCLRCVDPKRRTGVDCSVDYEVLPLVSYSDNGGDSFFSACTHISGLPQESATTCHFPGVKSCVVREYHDWHCIDCGFLDGSGVGLCGDASEPLPDPLADRPAYLPPPGTCTVELGADGAVTCAACTREDLSATRSCR